PRGTFSARPCRPPLHWLDRWRDGHLAGSALAVRLSFRPTGGLVLFFIFFGRGIDTLVFQVSGRPDPRTLGGTVSILCQLDLDELFRVGHSWVSGDRSDSSFAIQRIHRDAQSSPGNCRAVMRDFSSSFFRVPRGASSWSESASTRPHDSGDFGV